MNTFQDDLVRAVDYHGHLCAGQIIGVRMARLGLKLLGITDASAERDLIVYVEADRCIADAVGVITGCKLGRRRLKWKDYGKSAATFLHLGIDKAVRVAAGKKFFPGEGVDLIEYFHAIPDEEFFTTAWVKVNIKPEDLPGKPSVKEECRKCGEAVMDNRHVVNSDGVILCKHCAGFGYYTVIS